MPLAPELKESPESEQLRPDANVMQTGMTSATDSDQRRMISSASVMLAETQERQTSDTSPPVALASLQLQATQPERST